MGEGRWAYAFKIQVQHAKWKRKKRPPSWGGLELVIHSEAFKLIVGVGATSKWTSLLDLASWLGLASSLCFFFPKVYPFFFTSCIWVLAKVCRSLRILAHFFQVMKTLRLECSPLSNLDTSCNQQGVRNSSPWKSPYRTWCCSL